MLANASPLKPYVPIEARSSNALSLEVVNLSQRIGKSSFLSRVSRCQRTETIGGPATDIDTMPVVGDLE